MRSRLDVRPLLALLIATGCGPSITRQSGSPAAHRDVITAREIERSGARDLWEILERSSTFSRFSASGSSESGMVSRRGEAVSAGRGARLIFLDGTEVTHLDQLRGLPAGTIQSIRLMSGVHAPARYGNRAGAGAIVIETKHRVRPAPGRSAP